MLNKKLNFKVFFLNINKYIFIKYLTLYKKYYCVKNTSIGICLISVSTIYSQQKNCECGDFEEVRTSYLIYLFLTKKT